MKKGKVLKIGTFLGVLAVMTIVLFNFIPTIAYADSLQIIGGEKGLKVTPKDPQLFNELNLNPGDNKESNILIKNTNNVPFQLYLKVERLESDPPPDQPDLFKQLMVTVSLKDKIIYQGPMINFATKPDGINLGLFNPGESRELTVKVHLPGAETGNEFMGVTHMNRWIFIAQSDPIIIEEEPPPEPVKKPKNNGKLPQTGGIPAILFYIAGGALLITGVAIKKKD